ncbi:MAG: DNA-directed RNA polymerase subunit alpha C-terminal domain-containing protein [Candidatus Woesearchaeota archaeon]
MATPRILTPEQTREVTLCYLCGVETKHLAEESGLSPDSIIKNIVPRYSLELKDPLVEFYRQGTRVVNSAHLILSWNDYVEDIPKGELVRLHIPENLTVYKRVYSQVYFPLIQEVVRRTALEALLEPSNGYERMLKERLGLRDAERMVKGIFLTNLGGAYSRGQVSLKEVAEDTEKNLIRDIKEGRLSITPYKIKLINDILDGLEEREQKILRWRYGFKEEPLTQAQVGKELNLSGARIGQIEEKAFRRLRHPSRFRTLEYAAGIFSNEHLKQHLEQREREKKEEEERRTVTNGFFRLIAIRPDYLRSVEERSEVNFHDVLLRSVFDLDISVRAYNCLQNAGVGVIAELVQKTDSEMLHIRNLGHKTLKEIKDVLSDIGLSLGMRINFSLPEEAYRIVKQDLAESS